MLGVLGRVVEGRCLGNVMRGVLGRVWEVALRNRVLRGVYSEEGCPYELP